MNPKIIIIPGNGNYGNSDFYKDHFMIPQFPELLGALDSKLSKIMIVVKEKIC